MKSTLLLLLGPERDCAEGIFKAGGGRGGFVPSPKRATERASRACLCVQGDRENPETNEALRSTSERRTDVCSGLCNAGG